MIGGSGEKKTLLLVARYADACNLFGTGVADIGHKLDVLRAHCAAENRDYEAIEKTVMCSRRPVLSELDAFLSEAEQLAELGVTEVQVVPEAGRNPAEFAEEIAEQLLPRLAQIG